MSTIDKYFTEEEKNKMVVCFLKQNKETYKLLQKSFTPEVKRLLGMEK